MKHGDIVKVFGDTRLWIALNITEQDLKSGVNADEVGLHLFSGFWYSKDSHLFKKNIHHKMLGCYGKIRKVNHKCRVVGHAKTSFLCRKKMK